MLSNTIALGIAFCVMLLISPKGIAILHQLKFGQEVRDDGPQAHLKKQGTPTMGGILFLIAISAAILPFIKEKGVLPAYLLGLGFGIVGFIDDYLKVVKHQSEGFNPKQKMAAQIIISLLYIAYLFFYSGHTTAFLFPFLKDTEVTFGILFFGGLLGFLCFNAYPAKVFMGDTGSLALGGFVVAMAIQTETALYIPFFAVIYFMEVLSVILQVGYFKITHGKRIFKMAPIHHHFELLGWSETRVVTIFTTITILACFFVAFVLEIT